MSTPHLTANAVNQREQDRLPDGKFGHSSAPEADLTILPGGLHPALHDYEIDDTFPYPQANDLDKVVAVTDLVDGGADTADAVAHGLDVSPRQGAYYANAAGYLGLVEKDQSTGVTSYHLTELGQAFSNSEAADRAEMLSPHGGRHGRRADGRAGRQDRARQAAPDGRSGRGDR